MKGLRTGQHWELRAADTDRDQIVEQLREHCAAGRLTLEEFEVRLEEAWQARTYRELSVVTRELPRLERRSASAGLGVGRFVLLNTVVLAGWLLLGDSARELVAVPLPLVTALASVVILLARARFRARRARRLGQPRNQWQVVAQDRWRAGTLPPGVRADQVRRRALEGIEWTVGPSSATRRPHSGRWLHQGQFRPREGPWL